MASKKYTFKDFLRECRDAIKIVWTKIWGEDLPKDMTKLYPDEEYNLGEQIRYYEEDKRKLAKKRRIATLVIIILSLISFNVIKDKIKYFIENNPTIACWNKPVCIYDGPKLNYPSKQGFATKMDDGNYFIYKYEYGIKTFAPSMDKKYYKMIAPGIKNEKVKINNKIIKFPVAEIYNIKNKKFYKINLNIPFNHGRIEHVYNNYKLLVRDHNNQNEFIIYDIKTGTWEKVNPKFNKEYRFFTKYDDDSDIYITYYSNPEYRDKFLNVEQLKLTQKESLYFYNYRTFQYTKLPNFAKEIKFYPLLRDVRVLKNGKIILPIRKVHIRYCNNNRNYIFDSEWDHIEIYDPQTNKFYAESNAKVLDKNLFDVELDNGNILFVNQESAYVFNNLTNKFETLNKTETFSIERFTSTILNTIQNTYMYNVNDNLENYLNIKKLTEDKFLVGCKITLNSMQQQNLCSSVIFVDFKNRLVINNLKTDLDIYRIIPITENSIFINSAQLKNYWGVPEFPLSKVKVIKVNNSQ